MRKRAVEPWFVSILYLDEPSVSGNYIMVKCPFFVTFFMIFKYVLASMDGVLWALSVKWDFGSSRANVWYLSLKYSYMESMSINPER